jgi:DNA polymerase-3 subunit epsilon
MGGKKKASSEQKTLPKSISVRKVVLDTETTGISPNVGHRIVELAAIEIDGNKISHKRYHRYINPEREIDAAAAAVHGLSVERLQNESKFAEIAPSLIEFISSAELIMDNAPFDVGFLNSEFKRAGLPPVESICKKVTDTMSMAKKLHPGKRNDLDALCKRYGVDYSEHTSHGALLDAELLAEVYLKMLNRELH